MKKYFITGIVILLPLALTIAIVLFLVNLLTKPFMEIFQSVLVYYNLLNRDFFFFSASQIQYAVSQILILTFLFFFTIFLGFITRLFFFHYLFKAWEYVIHRIPLIRSVYKTCQDVINTIVKTDTKSFKQVVLVPFPSKESQSIGLITRDDLPGIPHKPGQNLVAVFVPTTPNPTSGYLIIYDESELTYINMKVEDALKYIISCGVILNQPFTTLSKEEVAALHLYKDSEVNIINLNNL